MLRFNLIPAGLLLAFLSIACNQEKDTPTPQENQEPLSVEQSPEQEPAALEQEKREAIAPKPYEPKMIETDDGLRVEILVPGSGPEIEKGDSVTMKYLGTLEDGTEFDAAEVEISTIGKGVRPGLTQTLLMLREGSEAIATIPPNLAYGADGLPGHIPPDATLTFELTILDVKKE